MRSASPLSRLAIGFCMAAMSVFADHSRAASAYYKEVCASGCAYNSVQDAIDDICPGPGCVDQESDADNVYTIFVDAGVLDVDSSISFGGKSYINLVGRSAGASILRASLNWFTTVSGLTPGSTGDLLDLSGSTNIIVRGITVDARTKDPGGLNTANFYNGIRTDNTDKILIDSAEILATSYGIWDAANSAGHRIDLVNSRVRAAYQAIYIASAATWHIFSSDIRGHRTGVFEESVAGNVVAGISTGIFNPDVTIWGCHVHGQSDAASTATNVAGLRMPGAARVSVIGTTMHAKITQNPTGNPAVFPVYWTGGSAKIHIAGSHLVYETPAGLTSGKIGGIGYFGAASGYEVTLASTDIVDAGGSGGAARSDIMNTWTAGTSYQPRFRFAALHSLQNPQKGTVTLSSGSAVVTLSPAQADLYYNVILTSATQETLSVTSRSTTQFTISSSNPSSATVVEFQVVR